MTAKVISVAGVPVEVATPGANVGLATSDVAGIVRATVPVQDLAITQVIDLDTAKQQITNLNMTVSELMQAMRNAGLMERSDGDS